MYRRAINVFWALSLVLTSPVAAQTQASNGQIPPASGTPIADQYKVAAKRIIDATLAGNDSYRKLEELCDDIGHRLSGSPPDSAMDCTGAVVGALLTVC